ncbi:hypothetical protein [Brachybacterium sacelli]|uniref:Polyketide cyclase / dehydrase and lipid transport n=1 Tax=Brachybacterium sacelli TaxID=173364 RepID=A0ABS4WV69_9MICO|nr:hypothetical protein [Brachybacterium sacelli]MBP2380099.1 hypothetical protein [Brachybacterium sacelli]
MTQARPVPVELVVRGDRAGVQATLEEFFLGRGWRLRERGDDRLDVERGSRRRTVFLGALAGKAFYLTARIEIRAGEHATVLRYRGDAGAGAALGGILGRHRAARAHQETAAALAGRFESEGRMVQVRRG